MNSISLTTGVNIFQQGPCVSGSTALSWSVVNTLYYHEVCTETIALGFCYVLPYMTIYLSHDLHGSDSILYIFSHVSSFLHVKCFCRLASASFMTNMYQLFRHSYCTLPARTHNSHEI